MDYQNNKPANTLYNALINSGIPAIKVVDVMKLFKEAADVDDLLVKVNERYGKELKLLEITRPFAQMQSLKTIAGWVTFLGILVLIGIVFAIANLVM